MRISADPDSQFYGGDLVGHVKVLFQGYELGNVAEASDDPEDSWVLIFNTQREWERMYGKVEIVFPPLEVSPG